MFAPFPATGDVEFTWRADAPRRHHLVVVSLALLCLALGACSDSPDNATEDGTTVAPGDAQPVGSTADSSGTQWPMYGHDYSGTRTNTSETAITRSTVADLTKAWEIPDLVGVTGVPAVVDGVAFFADWEGVVWAVDAQTGDEIWTSQVGGFIVAAPAVDGGGVYVASGARLVRLDRDTGEQRWTATTDDHPQAQISASPIVVDGMVIQGTASFENILNKDEYLFRGSIAAFDAATGEKRWQFFATPGDDTAGAGAGIWSTPAVDTERGVLYVGTGQGLSEPTPPMADSLLAIDAKTGELVWSTQFTYPDVFSAANPTGKDADVGASPNLWTSDGRDLVGAGDKGGIYHALDRETGEVVWESRLTPGSAFGGEIGSAAFVDGLLIASSNVGDPETNAPTDVTRVFALDPATGDKRWTSPDLPGKIFAPITAVPGVAFVGTDRGTLRALDTETGEQLWTFDAPAKTAAGPSIVDGRLLWGYGFILFGDPGPGGVMSFTIDAAPDGSTPAESGTGDRPEHASGPSSGCAATPPVAPGTTDERLTSGGIERSYQLVVPDSYDGTKPYPIVLGLHSLTVDYRVVPSMSGFADMQPTYEFVGVAPSGRLNGTAPYWNAAPDPDNYDVDFITELLDHLEATLCVDTAKVFSVGMSNGAQMSSLLACRLPNRITAVAPIAGVEYNEPCDGAPVPIMAFHGAVDPYVPYAGGGLSSVAIADQNFYMGNLPAGIATPAGVDMSMQKWARHNGCDAEFVEERISAEVRERTWQNCEAATILYVVDNGGHSWPGKPQPAFEASFGHTTTDIDASSLLFEFFFDDRT